MKYLVRVATHCLVDFLRKILKKEFKLHILFLGENGGDRFKGAIIGHRNLIELEDVSEEFLWPIRERIS
ncbi:MAG: hypothetical protein DRJ06_04120 [Candidatus Aminicenantes bacterium]|nr:MAG: hypothetical protein DRJ06_04120 [Candidatus Aminicenantes bacterium]